MFNSDQNLLEKLNEEHKQELEDRNKIIAETFEMSIDKKSIPIALLDFEKLNIDINQIEKLITNK